MTPNIEEIKAQLLAGEPDSVLDMLYDHYRRQNRPETDAIRENLAQLNDVLEKLPLPEMDMVLYRVCGLCMAYQHLAFTDGVGIGAKLAAEMGLCGAFSGTACPQKC